MTSIRQRTLGLALLVFGVSMLVIGFISYRYAAHEIEELYDASKDLHEDDHFQILCAIYRKLNATRACNFTDALAQTCWSMKELRAGVDSLT